MVTKKFQTTQLFRSFEIQEKTLQKGSDAFSIVKSIHSNLNFDKIYWYTTSQTVNAVIV